MSTKCSFCNVTVHTLIRQTYTQEWHTKMPLRLTVWLLDVYSAKEKAHYFLSTLMIITDCRGVVSPTDAMVFSLLRVNTPVMLQAPRGF